MCVLVYIMNYARKKERKVCLSHVTNLWNTFYVSGSYAKHRGYKGELWALTCGTCVLVRMTFLKNSNNNNNNFSLWCDKNKQELIEKVVRKELPAEVNFKVSSERREWVSEVKSQTEHSRQREPLIQIMVGVWNWKHGWNKRMSQDKVWEVA